MDCKEQDASKPETSSIEKMAKLNQDVLAHIKATEQRITEKQKEMERLEYGRGTYKGLSPEEIATVEAATRAASASNMDHYYHYYENMPQTYPAQNYWENQAAPEEASKPTVVKSQKQGVKQQKPSKSPKEASCFKKFAIGSYAHLLNEPVQAPEQKAEASKKTNKNKSKSLEGEVAAESENQKINQSSEDFNKIAANVKSTGQQKWKNSTQQTKTSNI